MMPSPMLSFIRKLPASVEFCVVLVACAWFGIIGSIGAIATHSWATRPEVAFTNGTALATVIVELLSLAFIYVIGRVRGWPFAEWGFEASWKSTGAGLLLFMGAALGIGAINVLANDLWPGAMHRYVVPTASAPFVALVLIVNPVFEEILEAGYFIQSLKRHGMWVAVVASAAFRAFLHAYQGLGAIVQILPIGLIFAFVYWKWRRLWPLFLAHMLFDLYALYPRSA